MENAEKIGGKARME